ncbi:uncharacterized protein [Pyxicephalus adspersus]
MYANQTHVVGYENKSALLSVSYTNINKNTNWFQIRWDLFSPTKVQLVICTITKTNGKKTIKHFPLDGYEKRMMVNPETGSLVIQHLKMEDSGIYKVSMLDSNQTKYVEINVTVNHIQEKGLMEGFFVDRKPFSGRQCICFNNSSSVDAPTSAWIIFSSRLSTILIVLLVCLGLHIRSKRTERQRMLSRLNKYR